jgi:hypothetical protein
VEFYTVEKLGRNQEETPEGFLLCRNVPIARTGTQLYAAREVPELEPSDDGTIVMERPEDEVFRPDTICSVNGKSITVDHPNNFVVPLTWRDLTVGTALNARRGESGESDLLLADLLITDHEAIEQVRKTRGQEVSAGYNYDGVQVSKGRGRQTNIWINHIALVDAARCGIRCSIKDSEGEEMKIWDRVKKAFDSKDCKAMDEAIAELKAKDTDPDGTGTAVHVHTGEGRSAYDDDTLKGLFADNDAKHAAMDARMKDAEAFMGQAKDAKTKDEEEAKKKEEEEKAKDAEKEKEENEIKDALADEAPAGEEEKAKKATDSSYLVESFQATKSKAEIIAPGIHLPAFDKAAAPKATFLSICGLRRKALQAGARDSGTLAMLLKLSGGRAFDSASMDKMPCGRVRVIFDSLAEMKRLSNNAKATAEKPDTASLLNADSGPMNAENFTKIREKARKDRGQRIN